VHDTVVTPEQRTEAVAGGVPVKEVGGIHSTQFALMVQPVSPHVRLEVGATGVGGATAPAPVTVKPLKTKLAEEQDAEEEHAEESSQDILPLQILQTGTIPV